MSAPQPLTGDELATIKTWIDLGGGGSHPEYVSRLVTEVEQLRELAAAVIQADDDSVSYEPCGECIKSGVALLEGASYDRRDAAIEALRAAIP